MRHFYIFLKALLKFQIGQPISPNLDLTTNGDEKIKLIQPIISHPMMSAEEIFIKQPEK